MLTSTDAMNPRACFKSIKAAKRGYRKDKQRPESKELSSHIW